MRIVEEILQANLKFFEESIEEGDAGFIVRLCEKHPEALSPYSIDPNDYGRVDPENPGGLVKIEVSEELGSHMYVQTGKIEEIKGLKRIQGSTFMLGSRYPEKISPSNIEYGFIYADVYRYTSAMQLIFDSKNIDLIKNLVDKNIITKENFLYDDKKQISNVIISKKPLEKNVKRDVNFLVDIALSTKLLRLDFVLNLIKKEPFYIDEKECDKIIKKRTEFINNKAIVDLFLEERQNYLIVNFLGYREKKDYEYVFKDEIFNTRPFSDKNIKFFDENIKLKKGKP